MKSLDRNSLEEQTRLVSRYVAGDLSRSERAEFEAWLVASPELAAEVEMERRLRRGIASAARRGWLKRGVPVERGRERHWQVALAASVLVSVGLGLSLFLPREGASPPDTRRIAAAGERRASPARTVRLSSVRGVESTPDLSYSLADAPGDLTIEPDVVVLTCQDGAIELECADGHSPQQPQYAEYEMDLVNRRGATLAWRSSRQAPVARSQLSFTLRDPGSLDAGNYDVIVRGHSPDHEEVVARFWLRVTAQ
jgi:ferric-dicitrate binding protein FerR (iron transport regulator)